MLSCSKSSNNTVFKSRGVLQSCPPRRQPHVKVTAFFGFGKKDEQSSDRDEFKKEQYRLQQDILERRRKGTWQKEVVERRGKVSKYMRDPEYKKVVDAENRANFLKRKEEEGPEPTFGIIIPLFPIGLPEYDGGERFDLRLPHVDNGWVDEEADFGKQIARFFSFGKKNDKKEKGK